MQNITRAWSWVHPACPLAPYLVKSDLFQNLTTDYGESALVLWDRTVAKAATHMLQHFVHPDRIEDWGFGYGDKEFFFLAFAFSGDVERLVMNPYMPANLGKSIAALARRRPTGRLPLSTPKSTAATANWNLC